MKIICSVGKGELEAEACLQCSLDAPNHHPDCGFDHSLLKALQDRQERPEIHVTDLLGCPLRVYYDKKEPAAEYPHEAIARMTGIALHDYLEKYNGASQAELPVGIDGLIGQVDRYYGDGRVVDYKTTRWIYPDKLPYGTHQLQVNIYAYLLKKQGKPVTSAAIQYIDLSGPTKCRKCKLIVRWEDGILRCPKCGNAPNGAHLGAILIEIGLLPDEEIEALINKAKTDLQSALDNNEPPRADPGYLCGYCNHLWRCNSGLDYGV
jgi:CRISPR/Cas system-associated exonuclease Cas4 (RecB family)